MEGRTSLPTQARDPMFRPHTHTQWHQASLRAEPTLPSEATGISLWVWPGPLPSGRQFPTPTSDLLPVSF